MKIIHIPLSYKSATSTTSTITITKTTLDFVGVNQLTYPLLYIFWTEYEKCHNGESYIKKILPFELTLKKSRSIDFVTWGMTFLCQQCFYFEKK